MIRSDLRTYLKSRSGLTDLVGGASDPRLYLSNIPQAPALANYPCVVYRRASGGYEHELDGSAGKASPLFEFHVFGTDPDDVEAIGNQLRLALDGFCGTMGDTAVDCVTIDDEFDDYIETKIGDDLVGFHRTVLEFTIQHDVAIPVFS